MIDEAKRRVAGVEVAKWWMAAWLRSYEESPREYHRDIVDRIVLAARRYEAAIDCAANAKDKEQP